MIVPDHFKDLIEYFPKELETHVILKFTQPTLIKLIDKLKYEKLEHIL